MADRDDEADDSTKCSVSTTSSHEPSVGPQSKPKKDPRKIARKYQLELCKKAMEENIIVYLGTGCGKTHIAVLLIYEMGHFIKRPQTNICVFLAPTVALVQQQAKVIEDSVDFSVAICGGNSRRLKNREYWEKEMRQYEVLVMTPQILLQCLSHCFIKMDTITLLIFDECHHAQVQSNHPYAEIMRVFYKSDETKHPRIFGMTASPIIGKGSSSEGNLARSINSLESLLDAKVYSVEDKEDLDSFVASATVKIYHFGSVLNSASNPYIEYYIKLGEVKCECVSTLGRGNDDDLQARRSTKKLLNKLHDTMIFCLQNLGIWGSLQAIRILLNHSEWNELIGAEGDCNCDSLCDKYLAQAAKILDSDCSRDGSGSDLSCIEVLKEPFFSSKLLKLIGILSSTRFQPNMKCIVFVNRIVTARALAKILQNLGFLGSWKCDFLVGINSGVKNATRKAMKNILEKLRSGELNLLIATKVGEEGLDIQTCCLVIRFDLPETVASFIQSRGRARMPQSEYAFLVDSGNQKDLDLIETFKMNERQMNFEIACRSTNEMFVGMEERVYKVDVSGASISSAYSISLLHQYCSRLPHDEYYDPKPKFFFLDDLEGTVCHIVLPSNAPMHQIVGAPHSTLEAAKKDACLKAIEELHKLGSLNDYLLPVQDDQNLEETVLNSSDVNSSEDEGARLELHEMLVPAALKEPWNSSEIPICLSSYYIAFTPIPADRSYKKFGLFVKENLPVEAEEMELELQLAHGRMVMTKLVPAGVTEFYEDEIIMAEKFQEMILKVMLDRAEFVSEFVQLGKKPSSSTSYLLLPVTCYDHDNTLNIDWKIIRKCFSSPVFRTPANSSENKPFASDTLLKLHNGFRRISDVVNSLVYVPHNNVFVFIVDVACDKNGHSPCPGSSLSHTEYFAETYDIELKYPDQHLLRAKQLFSLHNLLHSRRKDDPGSSHLDEHFVFLPPELCQLKIIGFSKDIGSSISLLPSIMHRLENFLVAVELKKLLSDSFPEGSEVTVDRVLEALTTEKCQEGFSLERLEILGDAFLKFAVGRHLFLLRGTLDEGQLTNRRSKMVNNLNLFKLACKRNLQVYIRDQAFDPCQFFALGHPCPIVCNDETERDVHSESLKSVLKKTNPGDLRCSKGHHWLHKKTVADAVEALVGAFIVDSGFKAASAFLQWIGIKLDFEASQVTDVCMESSRFISLATHVDVKALETSLGYTFIHKGLLLQAFVHPSYNNHGGGCYQRLEFLGDAVLDYLITSYLYSVYPKLKPGQLTDLRSMFVNNEAFANVALDRSFQNFIICGSSSLSKAISKYADYIKEPALESSPNDLPKCPKALGDLVESCIGAILLDTGFDLDCVWKIMLSFLDPIMSFSTLQLNPIREIQELYQTQSSGSPFSVTKKGNMYLVEVDVTVNDLRVTASATNASIKEAKKIASEQLFIQLVDKGFVSKSRSLEEELKSSPKMEAKLIGYNEIPIDVAPPITLTDQENLGTQEPTVQRFAAKREAQQTGSPSSSKVPNRGVTKPIDPKTSLTNGDSQKDTSTARSRLYEICTANCWKAPKFECCDEEGPGHLKLFTCKVSVEIEDGPDTVLECYGSPHGKKKAAAENAAVGALWFLEKQGYL